MQKIKLNLLTRTIGSCKGVKENTRLCVLYYSQSDRTSQLIQVRSSCRLEVSLYFTIRNV